MLGDRRGGEGVVQSKLRLEGDGMMDQGHPGVGNNLGLDARVVGVRQVGCWQSAARTGRRGWSYG